MIHYTLDGMGLLDKMVYKILADSVVLIHFLWIIFLLIGALWGRRSQLVKIFHLSGLVFALILQVFGWYCPLTHLEAWLRARHNPDLTYTGSFIIHYVERIVYVEISTVIILMATVLLGVLNVWIYLRK